MDNRGLGERREVYFSGCVQGVGFRYTTRHIASRYLVTGFVRNLGDGRVHLVAEGPPEQVQAFVAAVRAEFAEYIRDAEETIGGATGQFTRFEILASS